MHRPRLRIDRRRSSWLIVATVTIAGVAMMLSGVGNSLDRVLMPLRFDAVDRTASGKVAIVEMDAESAARIKRWPWSRSHYAQVVDRLRRAGAASIVFDVDFSSPSDAAGDRDLAAALVRADGLVALPTFGQDAGSNDRRTIDALPIPLLRDHAALASVSVAPDDDGQVRAMPLATVTDGIPRPTLSAFIAARAGTAGQTFPIDMSIDPGTIPRLSFIAVRDGHFDPAMVRGRNILIGATAIEMGDRYATPQWGVIPGVVVQALAAETLLRGVPTAGWRPLMVLLAALAVMGMAVSLSAVRACVIGSGAIMLLGTGVLIAQHRFQLYYPIATALAMIASAGVACAIREVFARFDTQRSIDEATGLPNARSLLRRSSGDGVAVLAAAQIDNYDELSAVLGAQGVATVMLRVSERIALIADGQAVYRTADHQLSFVMTADQVIDDTLDGLRAMLLQPVEVAGRRADVTVSIGVATGQLARLERLLTDATLAAEAARAADTFWQRAATDLDGLERSISLMGELDEAIAAGEIDVFYQPKYDLRDDRIASVEALVRWRHPVRGFIGPDLFIPIAERTNRIAPLTLYVLSRVLRDLADWRVRHPHVTAAINISAKLLSAGGFNSDVERIVAASGVPTGALVFEVTESAAMSDTATAIAALHHYRKLGIAVSMDDYGTGQSTLTYLRQLPLNELKIDRSFVQFAHQNRQDAVLVNSTIELAHQLGLKVVAEGIEDPECLDLLRSYGCDLVQGYLISKPIAIGDLLLLLEKGVDVAA